MTAPWLALCAWSYCCLKPPLSSSSGPTAQTSTSVLLLQDLQACVASRLQELEHTISQAVGCNYTQNL